MGQTFYNHHLLILIVTPNHSLGTDINKGIIMKIRQFLSLITMLSLAPVIASGFSDKVDVGPYDIGFTINASAQPTINTSGTIKQSGFDEYRFGIRTNSLSPMAINVTIDDYQNSTDVSETRLMNLMSDMIKSNSYKLDWNKVSIGSISGIMAQVQDSESFASYSITAYSPDGDGKKGNTIVLIESFLSRDVTSSFLKDLKIQHRQL